MRREIVGIISYFAFGFSDNFPYLHSASHFWSNPKGGHTSSGRSDSRNESSNHIFFATEFADGYSINFHLYGYGCTASLSYCKK